jgi:hypothetical protein
MHDSLMKIDKKGIPDRTIAGIQFLIEFIEENENKY